MSAVARGRLTSSSVAAGVDVDGCGGGLSIAGRRRHVFRGGVDQDQNEHQCDLRAVAARADQLSYAVAPNARPSTYVTATATPPMLSWRRGGQPDSTATVAPMSIKDLSVFE